MSNFLLFIETKDDIEVDIEDKHVFIQVKGQSLSLTNLLSIENKNSDNKKCIFSKNIKKNHPKALYHIVLLSLKNDQKDVIEASENTVFSEEYLYSDEQQNKIIQKLKEIGFTEEELNSKLPLCRLYFTPFKNKKEDAAKFLIGCMCDKNIKVDERGKILLNELFSVINQKAEKVIKTPEDIEKKKIDKKYLTKLFETNETYAIKEDILTELYREKLITYPEKYNIYQSVGDTAGPGGVSRALRTVPFYEEFAAAIEKYCPDAWVINFTNPMSICTKTLYDVFPSVKAFGCCHEVFHTQDFLCDILEEFTGIKAKRKEIYTEVAGINHFTWISSAKYKDIEICDNKELNV